MFETFGSDDESPMEIDVIFPTEFNFPGGSKMGESVLCFIRAYRWCVTSLGEEYREPAEFVISDDSCFTIAYEAWQVICREID